MCSNGKDPVLVACRVVDEHTKYDLTDDVEVECTIDGLVCLNGNQTDETCEDYEVQYLCDGMYRVVEREQEYCAAT